MDEEGSGRGLILIHYSGIRLEGLRKATTNFTMFVLCLRFEPQKSEALSLEPIGFWIPTAYFFGPIVS